MSWEWSSPTINRLLKASHRDNHHFVYFVPVQCIYFRVTNHVVKNVTLCPATFEPEVITFFSWFYFSSKSIVISFCWVLLIKCISIETSSVPKWQINCFLMLIELPIEWHYHLVTFTKLNPSIDFRDLIAQCLVGGISSPRAVMYQVYWGTYISWKN